MTRDDQDGHYIMIKESNLKRDKTILNVHANDSLKMCATKQTEEEE